MFGSMVGRAYMAYRQVEQSTATPAGKPASPGSSPPQPGRFLNFNEFQQRAIQQRAALAPQMQQRYQQMVAAQPVAKARPGALEADRVRFPTTAGAAPPMRAGVAVARPALVPKEAPRARPDASDTDRTKRRNFSGPMLGDGRMLERNSYDEEEEG